MLMLANLHIIMLSKEIPKALKGSLSKEPTIERNDTFKHLYIHFKQP